MSKEMKRTMTKQEFEQTKEDFYAIYQLKSDAELENLMFMDLEWVREKGHRVEFSNYEMVYAAPWDISLELDEIYTMFNANHPKDYKTRSVSVSDVIVIKRGGIIECYYVDGIGYKEITLEFWQPFRYAASVMNRFFSIQSTDDGYDFSIYDERFQLLDGGIFDDWQITIDAAWQELYSDFLEDELIAGKASKFSVVRQVDFELLDEMVRRCEKMERGELHPLDFIEEYRQKTSLFFHKIAGKDAREVEEAAWEYLLSRVKECNLDIDILDLAIYGSRSRGIEKRYDADIDIVFEYKGNYAEDTLFNIFNDDVFTIGDVLVDLNPICRDKSGSLHDYLLRHAEYYRDFLEQEEIDKKLPYYKEKFPLSVIEEELKKQGFKVERQKVEKISGIYDGLVIVSGASISPVIYMEAVLNYSTRKEWNLEQIVEGFVRVNQESMLQLMYSGLRPCSDEQCIKRNLDQFEGIEEYIYINIPGTEPDEQMPVLDADVLKMCKIPEEIAWDRAEHNSFADACVLQMPGAFLYAVTNKHMSMGAACILSKGVLKKVKQLLGVNKIYAIPSSKHEFIVLAYEEGIEEEALNAIIQDVNRGIVSEDEYLGDKVYILDI